MTDIKRLTVQRIRKEYRQAYSQLDDYWNDVEIVVDGRAFRALYTNSPEEAIDRWKEGTGSEYKRMSVRINHMDDNGDIQDLNYVFEHELGT